jgi:hypothetical protein
LRNRGAGILCVHDSLIQTNNPTLTMGRTYNYSPTYLSLILLGAREIYLLNGLGHEMNIFWTPSKTKIVLSLHT